MKESFLFSTDNRTSVKCKIISFVAVHFFIFQTRFFFLHIFSLHLKLIRAIILGTSLNKHTHVYITLFYFSKEK